MVVVASLPELLELSSLAPEVESLSESAAAIAPLMALMVSVAVIRHTAAKRQLRLMIMNVSSQRSFGVSC
ncbi:hypothetical protein [Mycolicibacterium mageritense]|uniref:hypothetical protein n=1 Tax=Mycolicibacterium mageritense TaxID=53462 RepID=UPI0011D47816|nr:hypothetical protein [Mycolicibacterium mageritense]TXI58654.1 MAG: hypothetical protein E6Q55_23090 [Mycolicibacterium mageritense]